MSHNIDEFTVHREEKTKCILYRAARSAAAGVRRQERTGCGLRVAAASARENDLYCLCRGGAGRRGGTLSQADPVHCRYGRVLLLIRLGRSAVGISYRSYSGGRGCRPPPDIFIEARDGTRRKTYYNDADHLLRCTNL